MTKLKLIKTKQLFQGYELTWACTSQTHSTWDSKLITSHATALAVYLCRNSPAPACNLRQEVFPSDCLHRGQAELAWGSQETHLKTSVLSREKKTWLHQEWRHPATVGADCGSCRRSEHFPGFPCVCAEQTQMHPSSALITGDTYLGNTASMLRLHNAFLHSNSHKAAEWELLMGQPEWWGHCIHCLNMSSAFYNIGH